MLPSRGLRPAHLGLLSLRQAGILRSSASRKFSSLPRTAGLSAPSCRASPLQSAKWRTGSTGHTNVFLTASSVRNGSWYAPWSWGKSSSSGTEQVPVAEFVNNANAPVSSYAEPAVTTATPELAPAGIDQAPVVNHTTHVTSTAADPAASSFDPKTVDELLGLDPVKDIAPKVEFDPTALIDHSGQLKELGLDYGWGMTTMFEKTIEQIYLNSGYGWAGSIMIAGVAVRGVTFFFQALSSDKMGNLAALKPLTAPIQDKLDEAIKRGDKEQVQLLKMKQAQVLAPHMGGMFSMGGFMVVQAWIGFCAFRLLRAMGELPVPGMTQDGLLWFTDLTVRDPYFVLPAVTTGIFYAIFKTGGETGVSNDMGDKAGSRAKLMTGMAFVLGAVTAFQASGLQLYFLVSGVLGAGTGWLLRQNGFRRFIRISPLPSKESQEVYTKVVKGQVRLADIKDKDGKVRYQAPRPINMSARRGLSGITIKEGTELPAHLRSAVEVVDKDGPTDRDVDYAEGPKGSAMEKLDYYRRNYRLSYMWKRTVGGIEKTGKKYGYVDERSKEKRRADAYEIERRRRFENRK